MHSFFSINLREEPLFAFRLQVVQNFTSYKMDKNAESAKMSHEALTTSVMRATMQMDKNADSAFLYHY